MALGHLDQFVVLTRVEVGRPNQVVGHVDGNIGRLTEILRLLVEENFEQSRIFSVEMLEFDFLAGVLEAEKAELLDLFFIESFFMGVEGTLGFKVILRDFIGVEGHLATFLLEVLGHQGPSATVGFLVAIDLEHRVVVVRMHPVDTRFSAGAVFKQVEAVLAGVVLGASQSNIGRRGEFRFRIVNEISFIR